MVHIDLNGRLLCEGEGTILHKRKLVLQLHLGLAVK